jgi:hypothetical protein
MIRAIIEAIDADFLWVYITFIAPIYIVIAGLGIYGLAIYMTREKS